MRLWTRLPPSWQLGLRLLLLLLQMRRAHGDMVWVTVDETGPPRTISPLVTTVSGTPTIISGAPPFDLTATVRSSTKYGKIFVSTGLPSVAVADNGSQNGAGAFPLCTSTAAAAAAAAKSTGLNAPFCFPKAGSHLHPGTTYYSMCEAELHLPLRPLSSKKPLALAAAASNLLQVTWDPALLFLKSNASVIVQGSYANTDADPGVAADPAFKSSPLAAGRGFYAWSVDSSVMRESAGGVNVSISIMSAPPVAGAQNVSSGAYYNTSSFAGPTVLVTKSPTTTYHEPPAPTPSGPELYIGVPVVITFAVVMIVGTCLWNHKARRIGLVNVSSRRRLFASRGRRRNNRNANAEDAEESVRLMDFHADDNDGDETLLAPRKNK